MPCCSRTWCRAGSATPCCPTRPLWPLTKPTLSNAWPASTGAGGLVRQGDALRAWVEQGDKTQVDWLEPQGRKGEVALRSAPLDAGKALAAELYPRFKALIFSSATMATHKGLDFARKRL